MLVEVVVFVTRGSRHTTQSAKVSALAPVPFEPEPAVLHFVIHWKGGCHTQVDLEKPRQANQERTPSDALDIIRAMASRYGDGQIAAVLNKSALRTGKGRRWTQTSVATARRNYSIAGQRTAEADPETLSLNQAATHCGVSQYTIQQLVRSGLLENRQVVRHAPWEIKKEDLDSQSVRRTLERLRRTGKLVPEGGHFGFQDSLPIENTEDDNRGCYE